ncbi:MAG: DUF4013 domain-containing protein [Candidatus Methanoperedens sp.]|nr:DUF4013 domain-containing protein [Candidatus Methanoperedens sp.]
MAADIERALKYPLNFKPLFVLGILFGIMFIALILPVFVLEIRMEQWVMSPGILTPLLFYSLFVLAALIIMGVFFNGYLVNVSRSIIAGDLTKAPGLTVMGSIFTDGLKFIVVCIVYFIPPAIALLLAVFIFKLWGIFFMFLLFPLFYVFHLAGAHLACTNSLKKALDIPHIYSLIFKNLKGFTLSFIIYLVITFVFFIGSVLIVTYPFVIIAAYVAGQYIFTIFYMEASGLIAENRI